LTGGLLSFLVLLCILLLIFFGFRFSYSAASLSAIWARRRISNQKAMSEATRMTATTGTTIAGIRVFVFGDDLLDDEAALDDVAEAAWVVALRGFEAEIALCIEESCAELVIMMTDWVP
jgi:hypothetical protein